MSDVTEAAKAIRKELKNKFPGTKFSVTSQSYSMGNSVRISYENGPTSSSVNELVDKYQDGDFDGMEDLYNYRSNPDNLPRAKYVIVQRYISQSIIDAKTKEIAKYWGIKDMNNDKEWFDKFYRWDARRSEVHQELSKQTL